eukprot:gene10796-1577_t
MPGRKARGKAAARDAARRDVAARLYAAADRHFDNKELREAAAAYRGAAGGFGDGAERAACLVNEGKGLKKRREEEEEGKGREEEGGEENWEK